MSFLAKLGVLITVDVESMLTCAPAFTALSHPLISQWLVYTNMLQASVKHNAQSKFSFAQVSAYSAI